MGLPLPVEVVIPDKQEICHDCGSEPSWWFARAQGLTYCRRCFAKGGNEDSVRVDPDRFLGFMCGELATEELIEMTLHVLDQVERK